MTVKSAPFAAIILAASSLSAQVAFPGVPVPPMSVIDSSGNAYTIGLSYPTTPGSAQPKSGGGTCQFVNFPIGVLEEPCPTVNIAKTDSSGNVIFSTLLGGQTADHSRQIAIDAAGSAYVLGYGGPSLPTTPNAAIPTSSAANTSFAAKLSPDGSRFVFVTYLPSTMSALAIAADGNGNAYVTGGTQDGHAYVLKISADGTALPYTTRLAGSQIDTGLAIAADATGNVVVTGTTNSFDFPISNSAVQTQLNGKQNLFITKLDPGGNIVGSTLLGGSAQDQPSAVQIDSSSNVYVTGATTSLDFPTTSGAFQPRALIPLWSSTPGGFAAKLAPDFTSLRYSTYITTTPLASGVMSGVTNLALGSSGDIYVSGVTGPAFPLTNSAPSPCFMPPQGVRESFIAHLDANGALADASYSGGDTILGFGVFSDGFLLSDFAGPNGSAIFSKSRFNDPPGPCLTSVVLNSASFAVGTVSPGEFVTLTGLGIGPQTGVGLTPDALGRPPVSLGGVQVLFDGQAAPLLYAQSGQINALAPFEIAGKQITNITVQFGSRTFGPISVPVIVGPVGIFRKSPGFSADAAATNQDGTLNSPNNPAPRGSIISVWGTGFGPTPGCTTGGFNPSASVPLASSVLSLVGTQPPAAIDYVGSAPTFLCGVEQLNIRIPITAEPGPFFLDPAGSVIYVK